jgi:hypothetical protein
LQADEKITLKIIHLERMMQLSYGFTSYQAKLSNNPIKEVGRLGKRVVCDDESFEISEQTDNGQDKVKRPRASYQ